MTTYYSEIIAPEDYNKLMSDEHLYISASDKYIHNFIKNKAQTEKLEVVELGCGPARLLQHIVNIDNINLSALDIDIEYLSYSRNLLSDRNINFIESNITEYNFNKEVDIFYSQGFHHHVPKGPNAENYLMKVYQSLKTGGYYVLSDEFIPDYNNEEERAIKLVIWYCHIIANALKNGYHYLAREEAKTLLDDIEEGAKKGGVKSLEQIDLILFNAPLIEKEVKFSTLESANKLAIDLLNKIEKSFNILTKNDKSIDLSRKDYKISSRVFEKEIKKIGFMIEEIKPFGPIDKIGAMLVYVLKKV